MRRPVIYAQAIATVDRAAADAIDARSCHEVQVEIVTAGSMVQGPRMPREGLSRRYPMLVKQGKEQPAEAGVDTNPIETGNGDELNSLEPAQPWRANSFSHERARRAMAKPASRELAIRRQFPSLPSSRYSRVDILMAPHQASPFHPIRSKRLEH